MLDTISRQAAIEEIARWMGYIDEDMILRIQTGLKKMPSAQPEQRWIPFTKRELTAEEQEEHPEWSCIMECPLPDEGQEILVSNGKRVWLDTFCVDDGCYLDSDHELEGCAWMPLPEPWKGAKMDQQVTSKLPSSEVEE